MLKLEYKDYTLDFKFDAGTSRGILKKHPVFIIKISEGGLSPFGYGEAAPLERLSVEKFEDVSVELEKIALKVADYKLPTNEREALSLANDLVENGFPSIRFALETALLDLLSHGKQRIFENDFYASNQQVPINGLIWMGEKEYMRRQVDEKIAAGFKCIKIKVGAIDWDQELELIDYLRSKSHQVIIRLDANGGFPINESFARLSDLERFDIHSIEQPIMPKQPEAMKLICEKSKIPIALDEELIGVFGMREKEELLDFIRPSFIILKPSLLGGITATLEWIAIARKLGIDWWMTSALESNIGLNAISQFAASFDDISYQGLGTGQLYHNNIKSPLQVNGDSIRYNGHLNWDMPF
ncbi:MAG: o-succinylbenzoate synthase [Cyclobacteriaceae bacterium]